jgi:quinol monooxygenase YgiN
MLIVSGNFEVDPAQREDFLAARLEAMVTSRAEAGCIDYVLSADPVEPSRVVLFERWESQEALDAHLARLRAPKEADGGTTPAGPPPLSVSIALYDVAGERPLG